MKRILITGAAGCLGSSLTRRLVEQGHHVHVLVKPGRWHPFLEGLQLTVHRGDIRNAQDVMHAMDGCEEVYQVAGVVSYALKDHREMFETHVLGVRTVLEAAKKLGVRKVVVTASTAGIGIPADPAHPLTEESPFDHSRYRSVMYMYSKHLTLQECRSAAANGLQVCAVSPTTIYGAGDAKMHVGGVVRNILKGRVRIAPPGGNSVVSLRDTVDAHLLAMAKGRSGENYIVAHEQLSYLAIFNTIARLLSVNGMQRTSPLWIQWPLRSSLMLWERALLPFGKRPRLPAHGFAFTCKHRYFDASKARRELGWMPKISFDEAIREAIEFYRTQGLL